MKTIVETVRANLGDRFGCSALVAVHTDSLRQTNLVKHLRTVSLPTVGPKFMGTPERGTTFAKMY
eukprot:6835545-Ditylum_brightwellii.AAC.1